MSDFKIPFSLELEAKFRTIIRDALSQPENKEFQPYAGVLINMVLFEMSKFANDKGADVFELYSGAIDNCMEFSFLSCYIYDWLNDKDFKDIREEIEKREKKITGKVSNYIEEPIYPNSQRKSKVLNRDGLDPDRELTQEEIAQSFESDMKHYSERYGLSVNDFPKMIGTEVRKNPKNRRKKPQGFGRRN